MKSRFNLIAATPALPDHIVLSKTTSPDTVYVFIKYSSKSTGFFVVCTSLPFTLGCAYYKISIEKRSPLLFDSAPSCAL